MSHAATKVSNRGATSPGSSGGSSESPPPPDGGWGWVVAFASFMIHIVTDGMTYSFGIFYNEFLTYFKEGKGKTALIVSILVGVTLCSGPISSSLVNRWGCRAVTVAGAVLAAVCVVASAFANNVFTLIITIGVGAGFGLGLIYLPAIVSVTVWFEHRRSLATGIAVCGSGLGTFLFAPITSGLISYYGWRGAMAIIGAFILNCVPLGLLFLPVPELPKTSVTEPMLPKPNNGPLKRSQSTQHVIRANGKVEDSDVARLTLSQPALNKPPDRRPHSHHRIGSRIMQRPDVLYQGSTTSLTKFRSSIIHRPQTPQTVEEEVESDRCNWLPCSSEVKTTLADMLDFSLLTDPTFILFTISNFLTSIGFYIPYVYTVPMIEQMGVPNPAYIISIIGASNLLGRILLGYVSDKPWINRLYAYNLCLTISGISAGLFASCSGFWGLAAYAATYGFCIGAYVGLTSVVLVDLLGLDQLTNAFGLLLLFQGIASLIGSPFAGWLYDELQSYAPSFYLAGVTISLSGLILFLIPLLRRRSSTADYCPEVALNHM